MICMGPVLFVPKTPQKSNFRTPVFNHFRFFENPTPTGLSAKSFPVPANPLAA